ncbi:recombinase family protein [Longimycelium tulufanense]|uniref:recombinase family protein n=1 Tax=Longimycelium tulufanense TaxID=907463 RepID=UPI001664CD31|nr:recombinase family protein [Longimycelium tulufanense]
MAFYGRVACADDPHTAIQRQLRVVAAALPAGATIAGCFADVGPWNGLRGSTRSTAMWHLDGRPVDGGLIDLLDRACRPDRLFDVVACSDVDRLSRRLADRVRIEENLAEHGVRVVTLDDPVIATPARLDILSATQQRLRRWAWDVGSTESAPLDVLLSAQRLGAIRSSLSDSQGMVAEDGTRGLG